MKAKFNLHSSERKPLVKAIEELTDRKGRYCMSGSMKYAFDFGDGLELHRDGTFKSDSNINALLTQLAERGFTATVEQDEAEVYAEREMRRLKLESENVPDYSNRSQYGGDEGCPMAFTYQAELSDPDCPDRMEVFAAENDVEAFKWAKEQCVGEIILLELKQLDENFDFVRGVEIAELVAENELYDTFCVEIMKNGLTDAQVQNIQRLVESKRMLLTKALGRPLTVHDAGENLQFLYPYSDETGVGIIYSQLAAAFVEYAKKHSRVTATEREVESEKFALRAFLVRLGMNCLEYFAARKNASFPHDANYAAMQASRRNRGQTDE